MPGYHNRKKKLYRMGGEMDSYKKGGKMPSWLVEMFEKKAKKSMNLGGNLTGGKLEKATRRAGDDVNEYYEENTEASQMLDNLGAKGRGAEKRFGVVTRYDDDGNPYAVKKGLLNETELLTNPMLDTDDEDYIVGKVKHRNKLGKMLLGSDAKAEFGKGGKMYYVTGGDIPEGDALTRALAANRDEEDIPAFDPNASWVKAAAIEDEEPGVGFQDGFLIDGDGPVIKGITLGSETTNAVAGLPPEMATMYLGGGEGKMQKKKEEKPRDTPDPEGPEDMKPLTPRRPRLEAPEQKLQKSNFSVPKARDRVTRQYKLDPSMKTNQSPRYDLVEKPGMLNGREVPLAGDSRTRPIAPEEIADYKYRFQQTGRNQGALRGGGGRDDVDYPDYDAALLSELDPKLFREYKKKYGRAAKPGESLEFLRQVPGFEGYEGSSRSDLGPGPVSYDNRPGRGRTVAPGYEENAAKRQALRDAGKSTFGGGGKLYHF